MTLWNGVITLLITGDGGPPCISPQLFFVEIISPTQPQWVSEMSANLPVPAICWKFYNSSWTFHGSSDYYCWLTESYWIYVVDISHLHVFVIICIYIISIPTSQPYFCPCWITSSVQQMTWRNSTVWSFQVSINFYPRKNLCINESEENRPRKN